MKKSNKIFGLEDEIGLENSNMNDHIMRHVSIKTLVYKLISELQYDDSEVCLKSVHCDYLMTLK